jgi:4,5-dihydroxyphthalate decarboxylase
MGQQELDTVIATYGHTAALKDGTVSPAGFALRFEEVPVIIQAFRRMVRGLEFDVSEMAFTTYLCAKAHGVPLTALPLFVMRGFHHGAIVYNPDSTITHPKDLEGRRVGVNRGYTVTTGVWARGILQDDYDVDLSRVTWVLSGDEHVRAYHPPANVVPMPSGSDLAAMVLAGELDAAIGIPVDRPGLATLIPDAAEAGVGALREHGLYPINHLVVVKDELLAAHPDLAPALFQAFVEAKVPYVTRLHNGADAASTEADMRYRTVMSVLGRDPLPYGIAPNLPIIDLLIAHAVSQGILDRPRDVADLFAAGTLDLVG